MHVNSDRVVRVVHNVAENGERFRTRLTDGPVLPLLDRVGVGASFQRSLSRAAGYEVSPELCSAGYNTGK